MDFNLFIVSIVVSAAAALLGVFIILRRLALVSDVLSHVALPGMALALLWGIQPFVGAFTALFIAIAGIFFMERKFAFSIETLVGIIFTAAMGIGIVLIPEESLIESLFGNISNIGPHEALFTAIIGSALIALTVIFFTKFARATFSQELAKGSGVPQGKTEFMFLTAVALAIALGIKVVGTLLMGALIIVPAVTAKNIAWSLKSMTFFSVMLGVVVFLGGVSLANAFDVVPGAAVILVGGVLFALSLVLKAFRIR
ncbi:metal ABC transporter permease [Candidatus Azambacteria bacterium]|nr:metal ABC transporter permease [Candidatus Azambacteria bacterium]MBI3685445.1 metal ABC transporter permease [Candidatus Azambacteria bacterium]